MDKNEVITLKKEAENHLVNELLPFWITRMAEKVNGGYITHFDKDGMDSGEDEKSLIAQTRSVYTLSSAHRASYGEGKYIEPARHGVDFLLDKMWDKEYGGVFVEGPIQEVCTTGKKNSGSRLRDNDFFVKLCALVSWWQKKMPQRHKDTKVH